MFFVFSECTNTSLVEAIHLDKLGLGYKCVFKQRGFFSLGIQWTVNGVRPDYYRSQFKIINYSDYLYSKSMSELWIKDPVALRGPTEIKCSIEGVSKTFYMNSEISLNIINYQLKNSNLKIKIIIT